MDDFSKTVERCAKNLENHTIFNASTSHAIVLFDNLLKVAVRENRPIKIFSGSFAPAVYQSLVESLKRVLAEKIEIMLICENQPAPDNEFVNEAIKAGAKLICLNQKTGLPHFILVGDSSYRVELDDALRSARANFNDASTGKTILGLYNRLLLLQA